MTSGSRFSNLDLGLSRLSFLDVLMGVYELFSIFKSLMEIMLSSVIRTHGYYLVNVNYLEDRKLLKSKSPWKKSNKWVTGQPFIYIYMNGKCGTKPP